jgi:Glycosyltransferase family 87
VRPVAGDAVADPFDLLAAYVRRRRLAAALLAAAAVLGLLVGVQSLLLHLQSDPLVDVQAYYQAGERLNEGLSLYPTGADVDAPEFYRYPPLLAILFRPLALLPFPVAAGLWETILVGALVGTLWELGLRRRRTWVAVAVLAAPLCWTMSIGQAQVLVTLLTAIATPWSIALAANFKLFPAVIVLYWIGRRDRRRFAVFCWWMVGLGLVQLVLEPANSIAFIRVTSLQGVGNVVNISPYAISPPLWAALLCVSLVITWRLSPTRWGWTAAVILSVVATPRLLTYMLSTLLAAVRPERPSTVDPRRSDRRQFG